ncbi:MAG: DUF4087 domain-containing protein [Cyanobacteria bacterium J06639_1]
MKCFRLSWTAAAAIAIIIGWVAPVEASELRCGWLHNPTPANWWLDDRDGSWEISVQGGGSARGMENLPDVPERDYVRTNGNYGYSCACLDVTTTPRFSILTVRTSESLPLKQCLEDPNLPDVNWK